MLQDARFALRLIAQRPGIAALITFTLAIGIAATTVVFSVADSHAGGRQFRTAARGAGGGLSPRAPRQPRRSDRGIAVPVAAFVESPPDCHLLARRFPWNCCLALTFASTAIAWDAWRDSSSSPPASRFDGSSSAPTASSDRRP